MEVFEFLQDLLRGHGDKGDNVELGGRAEEGGVGTVVEEGAEAEGKGRWESTVHFLFSQTSVWCTIINLVYHRTHLFIYENCEKYYSHNFRDEAYSPLAKKKKKQVNFLEF